MTYSYVVNKTLNFSDLIRSYKNFLSFGFPL